MRSDPDPESDTKRDDRDVAALIRAAGPRPAVPAERADRVRAAARGTWERETGRAARRRRYTGLAALAVAASLVVAVGPRLLKRFGPDGAPAAPAGVLVESLSGTAWAVAPDAPAGVGSPVALGERIGPEKEILTAADGRVALRLGSGHSLRLDHATRLRLPEAGALRLEAGAIYVDSRDPGRDAAGPEPAGLTVRTPLGTIEEVGTQFEVRLTLETLRVRLREGVVRLHRDGDTWPVAVGTELSLASDGATSTRALPPTDAAWDWAAEVAPPFALEGRTARAFLDWVVRERGLRLAFADEGLARSADTIILAGRLRAASPGEALDEVLPTCRMRYRVVDGTLFVDADPGVR